MAHMGLFLFSESRGHFYPRVISLVESLLNARLLRGIIAVETYKGLDKMKNEGGPDYLSGNPWLLLIWLQER